MALMPASWAQLASSLPCRILTSRIGEGGDVPEKLILGKMSIYIPQGKQAARPVERLMRLGKKRDRSVNYLVVEAILEYLKREEVA